METAPQPPRHFAMLAVGFEVLIGVTAVLLGGLLGYPLDILFHWTVGACLLGAVSSLPPTAFLWFSRRTAWQPLREFREYIDGTVVPLFRECRWPDLLAIALAAGFAEELFFRGILQAGVAHLFGETPTARITAWLLASVVFGLLHGMTRTYAVVAGGIGLYLGGLWLATGNLVIPTIAHALYNFIALIWLLRCNRPAQGTP